MHHGCGWESGAARERTAAHWLPASPRVTRSAPMAWALRARGRPWQPGHTALRYALGAEGEGAARPGAYLCSPRNCARCLLGQSWGGVGMSKTSCAARRSKVSRLRRTGHAPPARRGRRVRVPRAFKRPAKNLELWWWWWWWQQLRITSGRLPLIGGSILHFGLRRGNYAVELSISWTAPRSHMPPWGNPPRPSRDTVSAGCARRGGNAQTLYTLSALDPPSKSEQFG